MLFFWDFAHAQNETVEKELLHSLRSATTAEEKAQSLLDLGKHFTPYDYSKALHYLQEAREIARSNQLEKQLGDAEYFTSRVYYYRDDYILAKNYLEKARDHYLAIGDLQGEADYYFALGEIEILFGKYIQAIEALQKAIALEKESGDTRGISICLNSLSGLHRERGDLETAMAYAREALKLKIQVNDSTGIATCLTSIGSIYEMQGQADSSLFYFNQGLSIRNTQGDLRRIASSNYHLGRIYNLTENPDQALDHLNRAYVIFEKYDEKTGMIITNLERASSYMVTGQFALAQQMVDQAHQMALQTKNINLLKDTYKGISAYYVQTGAYKKAYEYHLKYQAAQDSILNIRKDQLLQEIELKYQSQLKDNEITNLKAKNELQQKNIIILLLSLGSLLIIAAFILYLSHSKSQRLKQKSLLLERESQMHEKDILIQSKETAHLQEKLESKNRELGSKILAMLSMNELQQNIVKRLNALSNHIGADAKALRELNGIIREIENHSADNLWTEFDKTFQSIHSDFYKKLLSINPDLAPSEIKIAAFLKLNLSTKEIAALSFKTESGIKSARHRLRKKLHLDEDANLTAYLMKL